MLQLFDPAYISCLSPFLAPCLSVWTFLCCIFSLSSWPHFLSPHSLCGSRLIKVIRFWVSYTSAALALFLSLVLSFCQGGGASFLATFLFRPAQLGEAQIRSYTEGEGEEEAHRDSVKTGRRRLCVCVLLNSVSAFMWESVRSAALGWHLAVMTPTVLTVISYQATLQTKQNVW